MSSTESQAGRARKRSPTRRRRSAEEVYIHVRASSKDSDRFCSTRDAVCSAGSLDSVSPARALIGPPRSAASRRRIPRRRPRACPRGVPRSRGRSGSAQRYRCAARPEEGVPALPARPGGPRRVRPAVRGPRRAWR